MMEVSPVATLNIRDDNNRRPVETVKPNTITTGRRHSSITADTDKSEARKLKLVLAEKEKQLIFLDQQLLISQNRVEELQAGSDRHKRQEREAKKSLSSKETHLRKQTVALKFADDKLQRFLERENAKIRRSKMERKELEAELERMEDEHEDQMTKNLAEIKNLEDVIAGMRDESAALLAIETEQFQTISNQMAEKYAAELNSFSTAAAKLEDQSSSLIKENTDVKSKLQNLESKSSTTSSTFDTQMKAISKLEALNADSVKKLNEQGVELTRTAAEKEKLKHSLDELSLEMSSMKESHQKDISKLEAVTEHSNKLFQDQSSEMSRLTIRNSKLQQLVEELSLEKSTVKSEKEIQLAEFMLQSQLKLQKLETEKNEKEDPLSSSRLSEESDLPTSSVSELWKSVRILQQSERNLKAQLEQSFKMLHVADTELLSKTASLKTLRESKLALDAEVIDSEDKIAQLSATNRSLEENLFTTRFELKKLSPNHACLQTVKSDQDIRCKLASRRSSKGEEQCSTETLTTEMSEYDGIMLDPQIAQKGLGKDTTLDAVKLRLQDTKAQLEESRKQKDAAAAKCYSLEIDLNDKNQQLVTVREDNDKANAALKASNDMRTKIAADLLDASNRTSSLEKNYRNIENMLHQAKEALEVSRKGTESAKGELVFSRQNAEGLRRELLTKKKIIEDLKEELALSKQACDSLMEEMQAGPKVADVKIDLAASQKSPEVLKSELVVSQQTVSALRWDLNLRKKSFETQKNELAASKNTVSLLKKELAAEKKANEDNAETRDQSSLTLEEQYQTQFETLTALQSTNIALEATVASQKDDLAVSADKIAALEAKAEAERVAIEESKIREMAVQLAKETPKKIDETKAREKIGTLTKETPKKIDETKAREKIGTLTKETPKKIDETKAREKIGTLTKETPKKIEKADASPNETPKKVTATAQQDELSKTKSKVIDESGTYSGHTNNKQKINYLTGIKQQIHELVEENQRLRDSAVVQLGKGHAPAPAARTPSRVPISTAHGRKT